MKDYDKLKEYFEETNAFLFLSIMQDVGKYQDLIKRIDLEDAIKYYNRKLQFATNKEEQQIYGMGYSVRTASVRDV